ncbi:MFS transporter [Bisporella sp. PMI_857]|nr:MFS transporter [Bisporella sp. PMI_857]
MGYYHVHFVWMASLSDDDPENPANFSSARKWHIVCVGSFFTFNSALGSSLPSGAHTAIAEAFHLTSDVSLVLLNSLYLVGFTIGPLIFGPMSEFYGRQPVLISTYIGYMLCTLACALSPSYVTLVIFRLLCGMNAAAPNAIIAGLYSDIYHNPQHRGIAMASFMFITTLGPQVGPIISGFVSVVSWRWTFWVGLSITAVGLPAVLLLPETFLPAILQRREKRLGRTDLPMETSSTPQNMTSVAREVAMTFSRPFVMTIQEPILLFSSLYLALIYAVLYLFFQAYPVIFQGLYGMSAGVSSLAFIPIMIGAGMAFLIFLWYSSFHAKAQVANMPWAQVEEYRRLPLAAAGAPLIVIALFWLGWTSSVSINPIIPMIAGVWFGIGYLLIFMAMLNYLTDAYKQYSASAQAAASTIRSIAAACLPLASGPMYRSLGIHWASTLLGFIALLMAIIPFIFVRYGEVIRRNSPFCQRIMQVAVVR